MGVCHYHRYLRPRKPGYGVIGINLENHLTLMPPMQASEKMVKRLPSKAEEGVS